MRILLSVVWLALAGVFFALGWQLWGQANRPLPALEVGRPKVELSGESFRFEIGVEGTPLGEPFRELREEVETYLVELGDSVGRMHRRGALACGVAGLASLASLVVLWMRPAPRRRPAQ